MLFTKNHSRIQKVLLRVAGTLAVLIVSFFAINLMTPAPMTWLSRQLFSSTEDTRSTASTPQNIQTHLDIPYGKQPLETLDILTPKNPDTPLPVIFWVHGGAFVGGDKLQTRPYLTQIANHGFAVVTINYSLAPEARYPTPIHQLGTAYRFVAEHRTQYNLDTNRVVFGGDSAGAQIALQFTNIQTNPTYSRELNIPAVVPFATIKAAVSLSGLLDISRFAHTDSSSANYLFKRDGESYFNDPHWQTSSVGKQASVIGNISANFPATFITDGNTHSFEDQARDFVQELNGKHVPIVSKFYGKQSASLRHEYQFNMKLKQSQEVFHLLVDFLHDQTKESAAPAPSLSLQ